MDLREIALKTLALIADRRGKYNAINKCIKSLQGDFPSLITVMDSEVEDAIVRMLDAILGDTMASYFLYEVPGLKGRGFIREANGSEWPITSINDLRAFVMRRA